MDRVPEETNCPALRFGALSRFGFEVTAVGDSRTFETLREWHACAGRCSKQEEVRLIIQ